MLSNIPSGLILSSSQVLTYSFLLKYLFTYIYIISIWTWAPHRPAVISLLLGETDIWMQTSQNDAIGNDTITLFRAFCCFLHYCLSLFWLSTCTWKGPVTYPWLLGNYELCPFSKPSSGLGVCCLGICPPRPPGTVFQISVLMGTNRSKLVEFPSMLLSAAGMLSLDRWWRTIVKNYTTKTIGNCLKSVRLLWHRECAALRVVVATRHHECIFREVEQIDF